jgi:hypothetical protein
MRPLVIVAVMLASVSLSAQQQTPPRAPRSLTASQPSSTGVIELVWDSNPPEDNVDGYLVQVTDQGGGAKIVDVGNVTDFISYPLMTPLTYTFRVFAYRGEQRSGPSVAVAGIPKPSFSCAAFDSPNASPAVSIVVQDFDQSVARNNPKGALVRFDAGSSDPITRIEIDLDGDGEPGVPAIFPVGVGFDGRYIRALAFKPTSNGTWPLIVTATDTAGRTNATRCTPGITVTVGGTP